MNLFNFIIFFKVYSLAEKLRLLVVILTEFSSILVFPDIKSSTFDANANSASGHQGSEGQWIFHLCIPTLRL